MRRSISRSLFPGSGPKSHQKPVVVADFLPVLLVIPPVIALALVTPLALGAAALAAGHAG